MMNAKEVRVQLVCTGFAKSSKGALRVVWRDVEGEALGAIRSWPKVRPSSVIVGGVYTIQVPSLAEYRANGSAYLKTLRFFHRWLDEAQAKEWEVEARQVEVAERIELKAKEEEARGSAIREALEPIRRRYQRSNATGRAALIGWLVSELERRTSAFEDDDEA